MSTVMFKAKLKLLRPILFLFRFSFVFCFNCSFAFRFRFKKKLYIFVLISYNEIEFFSLKYFFVNEKLAAL